MEVPIYKPTLNPRRPTEAEPGSPEKIAILIARAAMEMPLHVRGDKSHDHMPGMPGRRVEAVRMLQEYGIVYGPASQKRRHFFGDDALGNSAESD